jgi:methylase of polypeptide subunit release factors
VPGNSQFRRNEPAAAEFQNVEWRTVDDFEQPFAKYDTVFWEPRDTESLRQQIRNAWFLRGKTVLEIGTGTGLIAICCLQSGAARVVATDVNSLAIANARHNADRIGFLDRLDARLVPLTNSTAFSMIRSGEQFDLIVSNPPWENNRPQSIAEYALYDSGFQLLHSLLADGQRYLMPDGRLWLAYGCVEAIRVIQSSAPRYGWEVKLLDDRKLDELPAVFLPGMLLELTPQK